MYPPPYGSPPPYLAAYPSMIGRAPMYAPMPWYIGQVPRPPPEPAPPQPAPQPAPPAPPAPPPPKTTIQSFGEALTQITPQLLIVGIATGAAFAIGSGLVSRYVFKAR